MKLILLISLFSSIGLANSIEFITGGLTYHVFGDRTLTNSFPNRLTNDGKLIYNQLYGINYINTDGFYYNSYKFFLGRNSIGEPMGGIAFAEGFTIGNLDTGLLMGVYKQDGDMFYKKTGGIWTSIDYMPLAGLEFNYKIMLTKTKFIKINNYLSPIITNHTISIGENF